MNIKIYTLLLLLFMSFGCGLNSKKETPDFYNIFVGTWQRSNTTQFEIWEQKDSELSGKMVQFENGDSTILEYMKILKNGDDIFYSVNVPAQNEGKAVQFKLSKQEKNVFQFENPKHDFPKKIIYNFQNRNQLTAVVSGGDKSIEFNFKKIK